MTSPTPETAHSSPTERLRRRHVWHSFNFWLVAFTAVYSLISLAALRVAILSSRMARQSADASIATVRAWLDIHTLKFVHSLPNAPQPGAPEFSLTVENLGRTPAKQLAVTVEFVFDDQSADKQFTRCPETNLIRNPFMVAGPPGEPFTFPLGANLAAKLAQLNGAADSGLSLYAHGCVRYHDVMTNLQRLTEFCVRYYGGDNYEMCDNSNLMD
jgi:hypothetical protein